MKLTLDKEYYNLITSKLQTRDDFDNPAFVCWLDLSGNKTCWAPFIRKDGVYIDISDVYTDITLRETEENEEESE